MSNEQFVTQGLGTDHVNGVEDRWPVVPIQQWTGAYHVRVPPCGSNRRCRRWIAGPRLIEFRGLFPQPRSTERSLFKPAAIHQLLEDHRTGCRTLQDEIWRLLTLELWSESAWLVRVVISFFLSSEQSG